MAVKACVECGEMVSEDAKICPHCGKKDPTETIGDKIGQFVVGVVIFAGVMWWSPWSSNDKTKSPVKASAKIVKSPVKVSAKILVAQNMFGGTARVPIVEVTSIVDSVTIKNIIGNNGNCPMTAMRQKEYPQTIKYGQKATAGFTAKCNLLKVKVITNQGDWEYEFDYIPEQHVQM